MDTRERSAYRILWDCRKTRQSHKGQGRITDKLVSTKLAKDYYRRG